MVLSPGGEMSRRPLHFIWLLDISNSMSGQKIEALNDSIRTAIQPMRDAASTNSQAQVMVRVVTFSTEAQWHVKEPVPVEEFRWLDVFAGGETFLGKAFRLVVQVLRVPPMERRALPPVLALVTDGQPTDDWEFGLDALLNEEWGRGANRMAIAIGGDANLAVLGAFAGK